MGPLDRAIGHGHWIATLQTLQVCALLIFCAPCFAQGAAVPLRCQLDQGPWQDCRMTLSGSGMQWSLDVGPQRLLFRHDGKGKIELKRKDLGWRPVSARWRVDQSLCWGQVCAQGQIPLD